MSVTPPKMGKYGFIMENEKNTFDPPKDYWDKKINELAPMFPQKPLSGDTLPRDFMQQYPGMITVAKKSFMDTKVWKHKTYWWLRHKNYGSSLSLEDTVYVESVSNSSGRFLCTLHSPVLPDVFDRYFEANEEQFMHHWAIEWLLDIPLKYHIPVLK